jgi:hypothetical protein
MIKNIILFLIIFALGFLTHALFFPDVLSNGITDVSNLVIPNPTSADPAKQTDEAFTKVTYDGTHFSRHNVTISFTRYIQITNVSADKLMWLNSSTPELATTRGYGESETVQMQGNKKGQFVVIDKNNPQEKLVITVK